MGTVEAEPGIAQDVVEELGRRGQHVVRVKKNGGGYQAISIDWDKPMLHGASESRRDGEAKGY